jgi:hypothetical protein
MYNLLHFAIAHNINFGQNIHSSIYPTGSYESTDAATRRKRNYGRRKCTCLENEERRTDSARLSLLVRIVTLRFCQMSNHQPKECDNLGYLSRHQAVHHIAGLLDNRDLGPA